MVTEAIRNVAREDTQSLVERVLSECGDSVPKLRMELRVWVARCHTMLQQNVACGSEVHFYPFTVGQAATSRGEENKGR